MMTGERFGELHPAVLTAYLAAVLAATMFIGHPLLLILDFLAACAYTTLFCKKGTLGKRLMLAAVVLAVTTVGNGLFSHNGEAVWFVIGDTRYTMEAFLYGTVIGGVIVTVLLWFVCMGEVLTTDKILYLFAGVFPSVTLTVCMMLRYLPMLRRRYDIIHQAQWAMGRKDGIRQRAKEFSILISWSLENAIDTSDVMESRGYGSGKRSHYSIFVFRKRDGFHLAAVVFLGVAAILATVLPGARAYYFPTFAMPRLTGGNLILYVGYVLLLLYPAAVGAGNFLRKGKMTTWN